MISTHVLDTSQGCPAAGVLVQLEKQIKEKWILLDSQETNGDGRIVFSPPPETGIYRLQFHVESYFKKSQVPTFFNLVPVIFSVTEPHRKHHVPLLLSPFGYSTYRGS